MNSFLRDYEEDIRVVITENQVLMRLDEGILEVFFYKRSYLGLHHFRENILLNSKKINIKELAKLIFKNFSQQKNDSEFVTKVINSNENIHKFLVFNDNKISKNYLESEQKLLNGHPFHPYPKAKWGMSEHDLSVFSPEFGNDFLLHWIEIDPIIFSSNLSLHKYIETAKELVLFDLGDVDLTKLYIPMHPWQWKKIQSKINNKFIKNELRGKNSYSALSSMRTVFHSNSPFQLKFSMDISLTNSIRHLQPEECIRGAQIESVFKKNKITEKIKSIQVQFEPFYISLKGINNEVLKESVVQFRENTFINKSEDFRLLSTLCEEMNGQMNWPKCTRWFRGFLNNVIQPFIELQARFGILLGAHLQNIIVRLENGIPASVVFRDCQGSGFSKSSIDKLGLDKYLYNSEDQNILNSDDINKVFGYYLIVNSVFLTISSLTQSESNLEKRLLIELRSFLLSLRQTFSSTGNCDLNFIDYLLNSESLYQKGNMRCTLNYINENTSIDPWSIYNKIENPIYSLRKKNQLKEIVYSSKDYRNRTLNFRVLEENDLDLFHKWHHKKYVSDFWEMNISKDQLLDYIREVKKSSFKLPLILEVDNEPIGYFETYWAFEDRIAPFCDPDIFDRGIHLLIGEEKFLKSKMILDSTYHITKYLLEDHPQTRRVWGEPRADNRSIKSIATRLPGWKIIKDFDFPHKKATLLECDKERFYKEEYEYLS